MDDSDPERAVEAVRKEKLAMSASLPPHKLDERDLGGEHEQESPVLPANHVPVQDEKHFTVDWDGDGDPTNPKNKSEARKWMIVMTLVFGSYCVTNASALYTTTYEGMNKEFGTSRFVATLGLTTFVFGLGIAPMLLGPLSEFYGRRPIVSLSDSHFLTKDIPAQPRLLSADLKPEPRIQPEVSQTVALVFLDPFGLHHTHPAYLSQPTSVILE